LETVGHPVLFGTTFEFLQYFGLDSLDELPSLEIDERVRAAETETETESSADQTSDAVPPPE
jgi:segregation and condensation protein B